MTPLARGEFRIEVRMAGAAADDLRVVLQAPDGSTLHEHRERVGGEAARAVYQALMTAAACAMREDARSLTLDFAPACLLDLVHDTHAAQLSPVDRALQRWLMSQLRLFDQVWMHGRPLKMGVIGAASQDSALLARMYRQGTA